MNCIDFASIVIDLARGTSLDATIKQRGTAHAQSCVRCAGLLKTEQTLSRGLRAVAKSDQLLNAPASLETALLAAFRTREEAVPVAANVVTPRFTEPWFQRFFGSFKWVFVPAAVAALMLVAFAVSRVMSPTSSTVPGMASASVTPAPTRAIESPAPEQIKVPLPQPEEPEAMIAQVPVSPRTTPLKAKLPVRTRTGRVSVEVGPFELDEPEAISAKDFMVFDYAQTLPPADSTHLMRVRMPRERLEPLGIPLPRETRNDNFVNADFLVGSDGVPRAIRVANR